MFFFPQRGFSICRREHVTVELSHWSAIEMKSRLKRYNNKHVRKNVKERERERSKRKGRERAIIVIDAEIARFV